MASRRETIPAVRAGQARRVAPGGAPCYCLGVSDEIAHPGPESPEATVLRITLAYAQRWLRQLVTDGYHAKQPADAARREDHRSAAAETGAMRRETARVHARSLQQ